MYLYSEPRFRALNANLMMMALHLGYFIGPALAGSLVNHTGYTGFLLAWMALNLTAFTFCAIFLRDPSAGKKITSEI
jgi:MFS family permease